MSTCAAIAPETVREQVCALLPLPAAEVAAEDNLIALGLDSLHVMRLVSQWRRAGAEIGFAELIERPTLAAWQGLLGAAPAPTAPAPTAPRHDPAAPFALTDVQHAYWIGRQDGQPLGGVGCHAYLELDGDALDPARLDAAWRALLAHHPMLRARFDDQGRQRIAAQSGCAPLAVHDLRTLDPASRAQRLETIREALSHRRLAVERGEVAGLALSLLPEGRGRVHLDLDLLVADVESLRILLRDLARLYAADAPPAAPAGWSFADYLAAVETRAAPRLEADRDYWRARAATLPAGPQLPLRQAPETIDRPRFRRRRHWLDVADWRRLGERAQARGLTPALVLATAYAEVLARWSTEPRLSLNLPLFDRHDDLPGAAEAVADFTSLLLLEVDCATPRDFAARAATVQRQFHADMAHAGYCGVRVQRDLAHLRGGDGFAAPVVFACNLGAPLLDDDTRATLGAFEYMISQTPQVWLDHQVYEQDGALLLAWDAVEALFPEGMIDAMFAAYTELLTRLARDERAWSEPAMLPLPEAQRRVRSEVNATALALPPRLLHAGLFATARREPARPALVDGERVIDHGELAAAALRIAGWLRAAGLAPGEAVAVSLPRGAAQVAAVFGVLAAGGCYVPIGVEQPSARRARILERAGVGLVLDAETIAQARAHAPLPAPIAVAPSSPAYVIFTSGSTGEPKGVEVTHLAAANTIDAINQRYGVGPEDRVLAVSALDFDLSVYDLFGPSQVGGALVCVPETARRDAAVWRALIARHRVTLWNSVPVLLEMLLSLAGTDEHPLGLRLALVSGDWIARDLPARLDAATDGGCRMVAMGGATEAAIWSNAFEPAPEPLPGWNSIPYGRPLPNQCYRVVDAQGRDCPDWVPGELWIGGAGLASGYRGDAERTAECFVTRAGARWYRTGDIGRYHPDGLLEFLGRADHQVKVRGHRIELGEIETALTAAPAVTEACALTLGQPPRLGAAVVLAPGVQPEQALAALRESLAQRLPEYMIPTSILPLERLDLSANGKVDRRAIAARLDALDAAGARTPPRGPLEQALAAIWAEVLGREDIHREDDFFLLGGDSLSATRVVAQLEPRGIAIEQPLRHLFAHPRLADFAAAAKQVEQIAARALVADRAARHAPFPLTEIQRAYWRGRTQGLALSTGTRYLIVLDGAGVDLERLEAAWNLLIERHEMLRATVEADGEQRILPSVPRVTITVDHLDEAGPATAQAVLDAVWDAAPSPTVQRWPGHWLHAVRYGERTRIGLCIDYLLVDGFSVKLLLAELARLYADLDTELPPIGVSFRDYVLGVRPAPEAEARAETYWRARLDDLPPAPALPLARAPESLERVAFGRREARLEPAVWARLESGARAIGVTPSVLLLTVYAEVLSRWSGGGSHTLNLTLFDRQRVHPDIDAVVGDFTSLAALPYRPEAASDLATRARAVRETLVEVLEHRARSSIWLQRERTARLGPDGAALPVVFTSTLGLPERHGVAPPRDFPALVGGGRSETPQVWLDHQLYEQDGALVLQWDAVEALFPEGMLDAMFATYTATLARLAEDPTGWSRPLVLDLPEPQRRMREEVGATAQDIAPRLLHAGLFATAHRDPGRPALFDGERVIDHGELAAAALRIAGWLRAAGLAPGEAVAVSLPRGAAQVAAVFGVLAAGGCYVPIGVEQPSARRARILERAGVGLVLDAETIAQAQAHAPLPAPVAVAPSGPAYVIFTSGSTGEPKGVEVTHLAAANTIDAINQRYGVGPEDRVLAVSALDFDLSVYDLFGPSQVGGALVCVPETARRDAAVWRALIARHRVTLWNSVPVLLEMLLSLAGTDEHPLGLRLALVSGDWIARDLPARLDAATDGGCRMVAMGGATEAAIWSNAFEPAPEPLPGWNSIPYGRPLPNQCYRVVDAQGRDCPDWVPGELWIGGAGLASGYRGDAERTAERFVTRAGARWYRTGDIGRYHPDGLLEFLGRADQQVKVRGHRIELGEIETALTAAPDVTEACALTLGQPPRLGAAVVLAPGVQPEQALAVLRETLAQRLPEYMIPTSILPLERLDLSANGKVDRRAIAARLDALDAAGARTPPQGPLEQALAAIWAEVLGRADIHREDDFFLLGGDSLGATRTVERLRREGVTHTLVPLRLLFGASTLAAFAERIAEFGAVSPGDPGTEQTVFEEGAL